VTGVGVAKAVGGGARLGVGVAAPEQPDSASAAITVMALRRRMSFTFRGSPRALGAYPFVDRA